MQLRFLKAAHPQRDDRSNEQITQQAERPTPPTTVLYVPRVEVPCVVALENGNSQHFAVLRTSARPKFLLLPRSDIIRVISAEKLPDILPPPTSPSLL
jgi:hypothetical protein